MGSDTNNAMSVYETILSRLMRLDQRACVRMRHPNFPKRARWYVDAGALVEKSILSSAYITLGAYWSGRTPEEALLNAWDDVVQTSIDPSRFFMRYTCGAEVNIPGNSPQVWVRWSVSAERWIDIQPVEGLLAINGISADRIRPIANQLASSRG